MADRHDQDDQGAADILERRGRLVPDRARSLLPCAGPAAECSEAPALADRGLAAVRSGGYAGPHSPPGATPASAPDCIVAAMAAGSASALANRSRTPAVMESKTQRISRLVGCGMP